MAPAGPVGRKRPVLLLSSSHGRFTTGAAPWVRATMAALWRPARRIRRTVNKSWKSAVKTVDRASGLIVCCSMPPTAC